MRNGTTLLGTLLAFALLAAACSNDSADSTTSSPASTSATTTTTAAPSTTTPPSTTAATTTTAPAEDPLVIWAEAPLTEALARAASDFEAATGIPVDILPVGPAETGDRIIEAGSQGEPADIFAGTHAVVGELAAAGLIAAIPLPDPNDYWAIAVGAFSIGGTPYGLPYAIEGMALYRNTDLVPDVPPTFADLVAACDALGDAIQRCLGVPAGDVPANHAFVQGFGGYLFGSTETGFDATDVGLDGEGALAGADFLDAQVKVGLLDPAVGWSESGDLFIQGGQAFMWSDAEQADAIDQAGIPWQATAFPPIDGSRPIPPVEVRGFMISAFSEQPVAAQVFITEFVDNRELMFDFYLDGGSGPAHRGAFGDAVAANPQVAVFSPAEQDPVTALPNLPEAGGWESLGEAISIIYNQAYTTEIPDARSAFRHAAEAIRAALPGG